MDEELLPKIDGTAKAGPGGLRATQSSIVAKAGEGNQPWQKYGGYSDQTEAAERTLVLSARYATRLHSVALKVASHCILTQVDESVFSMTTGYRCVLAMLI
jgi:hypothetical protein